MAIIALRCRNSANRNPGGFAERRTLARSGNVKFHVKAARFNSLFGASLRQNIFQIPVIPLIE